MITIKAAGATYMSNSNVMLSRNIIFAFLQQLMFDTHNYRSLEMSNGEYSIEAVLVCNKEDTNWNIRFRLGEKLLDINDTATALYDIARVMLLKRSNNKGEKIEEILRCA